VNGLIAHLVQLSLHGSMLAEKWLSRCEVFIGCRCGDIVKIG
jgi:hypothetical protein